MFNRAWDVLRNKPKGYYDLKSEMKALYAANIPRRHPKTPTFKTLWNHAKDQDEEDPKHLMQWAIVHAGEDNVRFIQQVVARRVEALDETDGQFAKTTYVNNFYEKNPELEQFPPASDGLIGVTDDVDADEGEDEGLPEWLRDDLDSQMLGPGMPAVQYGGGYALSAASLAAVTVAMAVFASMR